MITITLTQALVLYSLLLVIAAIVLWFFSETSVGRYQNLLGKQDLWRCTICGFSYLDDSGEALSKCPRCGSYNASDDAHAREVPIESMHEESDSGEHLVSARRNASHRKRPNQRRRGPRRR